MLDTWESINVAACRETLERRGTELTKDEIEWLQERIAFLQTPAQDFIQQMRELYKK